MRWVIILITTMHGGNLINPKKLFCDWMPPDHRHDGPQVQIMIDAFVCLDFLPTKILQAAPLENSLRFIATIRLQLISPSHVTLRRPVKLISTSFLE
mmetsp:Transcript_37007/g.73246  ORF Transcript_37007/g.73246 Transcript_37007/m.73246 type:complete len:97 (-) Transcript_37007:1111-1401(-)